MIKQNNKELKVRYQAQQIVLENILYFIESDDSLKRSYLIKEENSIIWHHMKVACYNALVFYFGSKVDTLWDLDLFEVFKKEIIKVGK